MNQYKDHKNFIRPFKDIRTNEGLGTFIGNVGGSGYQDPKVSVQIPDRDDLQDI